jgi:CRISPR-associated endonuclease/helicase Cas3
MPLDHVPIFCCTVDGIFPLHGKRLPAERGTALYDALCAIPHIGCWLAEADHIAIAPVAGQPCGDGLLALTAQSRLLLRLPAAELPRVLRLAGRRLDVGGHPVDIGEPRVDVPPPAASLRAELVVLDDAPASTGLSTADQDPTAGTAAEAFVADIRSRLDAMEIQGPIHLGPPGRLHLPERSVTGFALTITNLTPDDSLHLQEAGLGGHRKLGCGVFVPA